MQFGSRDLSGLALDLMICSDGQPVASTGARAPLDWQYQSKAVNEWIQAVRRPISGWYHSRGVCMAELCTIRPNTVPKACIPGGW